MTNNVDISLALRDLGRIISNFKCNTCNRKVVNGIRCDLCDKWSHFKCEEIDDGDKKCIKMLNKADQWRCSRCKKEKDIVDADVLDLTVNKLLDDLLMKIEELIKIKIDVSIEKNQLLNKAYNQITGNNEDDLNIKAYSNNVVQIPCANGESEIEGLGESNIAKKMREDIDYLKKHSIEIQVKINEWEIEMNRRNRKRDQTKIQLNVNEGKYEVVMLADSHGRDCIRHIKERVGNEFEISGCIYPGAGIFSVIKNIEAYIKTMNEGDIIIVMAGSNDIVYDRVLAAINILNSVKNKVKIIMATIPYRYDYEGQNKNGKITDANKKNQEKIAKNKNMDC